jgi:hypothetical protein
MSHQAFASISRPAKFISITCFSLLWSIAPVAAQEWSLGSRRFETNAIHAARPLQVASTGRASLTSFRFVSRVGGVSFESAAQPDSSLAGKLIELSYDSSRPDGQRLVVRAETNSLRTAIPDWQIGPLVRYVHSDYNAAVSLFGEGSLPKQYYYPQYHDALKDTLLGMRLLQADILFMSLGEHWRLPLYGGKPVLGHSERNSNQQQSLQAAQRIQDVLRRHTWRAWVLTDAGTKPTFGAAKGVLSIRAAPYFFFWNIAASEQAAHTRLIDQYNSLVNTYNASRDAAQRRDIERQLDAMKPKVEAGPQIFEVTNLTNEVRGLGSSLAQYNPAVHSAYQRVAQYGSLFRYVKNANPANWNAFQQSVAGISVQPSVRTPTAWARN